MSALPPPPFPKGTYPLAALPPSTSRNKLSNLQMLAKLSGHLDFSVPPTHVLTGRHFKAALENISAGASNRVTPGALNSERAAHIRDQLLTLPLPTETQKALLAIYYAHQSSGTGDVLCLRSCFKLEDQPDLSFAGTFETVPAITSPDQLMRAAQVVYASVFSSRAVYELQAHGSEVLPAMSLAVQPMIGGAGWLGGVAHTQSPDLPLMISASTPFHAPSPGNPAPYP